MVWDGIGGIGLEKLYIVYCRYIHHLNKKLFIKTNPIFYKALPQHKNKAKAIRMIRVGLGEM